MNIAGTLAEFGPYLASFLICFVSGLVPIVNAELYLLSLSTLLPIAPSLSMVALASAAGQMASKGLTYFAGVGAIQISAVKRARGPRVEKLLAKLEHSPRQTSGLVFVSSFLGFPPLYILSIACGVARSNFMSFLSVGVFGRFLRFLIIVAFPELIRSWFK